MRHVTRTRIKRRVISIGGIAAFGPDGALAFADGTGAASARSTSRQV
jgi:hypothetical protein